MRGDIRKGKDDFPLSKVTKVKENHNVKSRASQCHMGQSDHKRREAFGLVKTIAQCLLYCYSLKLKG